VLTTELEDPELYTHADGVDRARKLGGDLDQANAALQRTLEQWTSASEALDALAAGQM